MFTVKRLLRGVGVALVVAALGFGTTQAFASTVTACTMPGQIGTCPPFDDDSCRDACFLEFGHPGACRQGCCSCVI